VPGCERLEQAFHIGLGGSGVVGELPRGCSRGFKLVPSLSGQVVGIRDGTLSTYAPVAQ
jgi:hypothetical protein